MSKRVRAFVVDDIPGEGISVWDAIEKMDIPAEIFLSWPFQGYDDCGHEVRKPPAQWEAKDIDPNLRSCTCGSGLPWLSCGRGRECG